MNLSIYLPPAGIILAYMLSIFVLAQWLKNNSIVDIFWGFGFVVLTAFYLITTPEQQPSAWTGADVLYCLVLAWGLRLSAYLLVRNAGKPEDWRYVNFRQLWTKKNIPHWLGALLQVFILQGFFMFLVALPVMHAHTAPPKVSYLTYLGVLIWGIGFVFEAVGDYQLARFKKKPENKGKIMRYGLWAYTRHPNYFGEVLIWWGIWLVSVNFFAPVYSMLSLISPVVITWLLTRVSGVPMLEQKYRENAEYRQYVDSTPAFFPKFFQSKG